MSNISSTRRGFSYQDKYALLQILIALLNGKLDSFKVDKAFSGRKSIDIEVILTSPSRICAYEVKTGEVFKTDKWKELRDALITLYEYLIQYPEERRAEVEFYLVVSPDLRASITQHWGLIKFIQESSRNRFNDEHGQTMGEIADDYRIKFGFNIAPLNLTLDQFIDFIKKINFKCEFEDDCDGELDIHSPLVDAINSKLDDIATIIGQRDGALIISNYNIVLELLEVIRQNSEGRNANLQHIVKVLKDAFAKRRYISCGSHPAGKTIDEFLDEYGESIEADVLQMLGRPQVPTSPGAAYVEPTAVTV